MKLKDKTFLITGVSKGIGLAVAKALDKQGAKLILVSRNAGDIKLTSKHIKISTDLTDEKDIKLLINKIGDRQIDGLLNIAGVGIYKSLEELTERDINDSLNLNLVAPLLLIKALENNLSQSSLSLVLTIGSGAGVIPFKKRSIYCASKFGLRGMILSLAEEFENRKPNFCLITLGSTITTFGGKSIEAQENALKQGKASFPVKWLADKLVEIIQDEHRETEIILYPSEHGFGEWKKNN